MIQNFRCIKRAHDRADVGLTFSTQIKGKKKQKTKNERDEERKKHNQREKMREMNGETKETREKHL